MRAVIREKSGVYAIGLGIVLCSVACTTLLRDHYTPAKWVVVYLAATLAWGILFFRGASLAFFRPYRLPFVALILAYGVGVIIHPHRNYQAQIFDWLAFSGLAYVAFDSFRRNSQVFMSVLVTSILLSTSLVLIYGFLQFFGFEYFPELVHNTFPSSFFGFQNMTAEFLGYSILTQAFILLYGKWSRITRVLVTIVLGLSVFYLPTLHCRSVYVALVPALAVLLYFRIPSTLRKRTLLALGVFWMIVGAAACAPLLMSQGLDNLSKVKASNAQLRIIRWMNTAVMIADHPLGTGPGSYEFAYLPYHSSWKLDYEVNERLIARSPHNEYLRVISENGLLVAGAVFVLWIVFLDRITRIWKRYSSPVILWVLGVLIFTAIDALFSFPLENAFPFLLVAVAVGVGNSFTLVPDGGPVTNVRNKWVFLLPVLFCGYFTLCFTYSKYSEANLRDRPEAMYFSCRLFPANWRPCIRLVEISIARKQFNEAEVILRETLLRSPHHFMALRFLSFILFEKGNEKEGCETLAHYDSLFRGQENSLHEGFKKLCPGNLDRVSAER